MRKEIDPQLERGYNVRALRDDYEDVLTDWVERSNKFRAASENSLDVAYGPEERQRMDIFTSSGSGPTLIYLHGGYWQRGDKSIYSFVGESYVDKGVNFVVMGYTLCPESTVPRIVDEVRGGLAWLYREAGEYGIGKDRLNLTGHSAGGHLTAMMLATKWSETYGGLRDDMIRTGIPISGLYDLDPLRRTSINDEARIDDDAARRCSPLFLEPTADTPVLAVVGGAETDAFHAQTEDFIRLWSQVCTRVERHIEPGVDHFDIVNRLADPTSALFTKVIDLLE